jgi:hypothetical protein
MLDLVSTRVLSIAHEILGRCSVHTVSQEKQLLAKQTSNSTYMVNELWLSSNDADQQHSALSNYQELSINYYKVAMMFNGVHPRPHDRLV